MYKHYIKIDSDFNITDYFCEVQQNKLDGSEIFYIESSSRQANLDIINSSTGYYKYYYENGEIIEKTPDMDFEIYKNLKYREIRLAFEHEFRNGVFTSKVLDIDVDCRRSDTKNDLQNVEILIEYVTRNSLPNVLYVGHKESVNATIEKLYTLIEEMQDYGLGLYQKKWALEEEIKNAKTIKELEVIQWI